MTTGSVGLESLLNVSAENIELPCYKKLQDLSNEKQAVLLTFIAPYIPKRVNPQHLSSASIGLSEELSIENALDEIREKTKSKKLILVINSPGGFVRSSFKIAKALQNEFDEITVFVPHIAASGGALIALSGNKLIMGRMSQLSPIDPQVEYLDTSVSAKSMNNAFGRLSFFFKDKDVSEVPFPWKSMAEKLDPVLLEEWTAAINTVQKYGTELLLSRKFEKTKIESILDTLIFTPFSHEYVIDFKEAQELFGKENVQYCDNYITEWLLLKEWVNTYLMKPEMKHFVRYVTPNQGEKNENIGNKLERPNKKESNLSN